MIGGNESVEELCRCLRTVNLFSASLRSKYLLRQTVGQCA